jgi:thiol-disulfide isomerase/thioredoxin
MRHGLFGSPSSMKGRRVAGRPRPFAPLRTTRSLGANGVVRAASARLASLRGSPRRDGGASVKTVLLLARVVLAASFAVAAVAKLGDREKFRGALAGFGVPVAITGPVAVLLPLVELGVALALVPAVLARGAAAVALALLALFSAAIAAAFVRGTEVDCRCFGELRVSGSGRGALARNAALAALAAVVLVWPAPGFGSATGWRDGVGTGPGGLLAACAVALGAVPAWIIARSVHRHRRLAAPERVETGRWADRVPTTTFVDVNGDLVDLRASGQGETLVLFWNPSCAACEQMLPALRAWEDAPPPRAPRLVVVSSGSVEANRAAGLRSPLILDERSAIYDAFALPGRPSAVLVGDAGRVVSDPLLGTRAILAAISSAA